MNLIRIRLSIPISFLILNNLVPILGLIFLDWTIYSFLFFFWLELVLIGVFNLLKIYINQKPEILPFKYNDASNHLLQTQGQVKLFSIVLFVIWYGIYVLSFGVVIYNTTGVFSLADLFIIGFMPFAKHLFSFMDIYLHNKEYEHITPWQQVTKPFWTTIPIVTMLILASFLGQYVLLGAFLVLKTIVEYNMIRKGGISYPSPTVPAPETGSNIIH